MPKFIIVIFENQVAESRTEMPYTFVDREVAQEICDYLNGLFISFSHVVEEING